VLGDWDVIVCGGGPSGCAAAISAACRGAKTLLVEKEGYLGGATVMSLVCVVLSTNGVDFQGIWHEWYRSVQRRGGSAGLIAGRNHISSTVIPETVKFAWDDLIESAGVQLLHHAYCCGAIVGDGKIHGILAETKAGRRALYAKRVIDCTGDGLVCHAAGVPWNQGDGINRWAMSLTKAFLIANAEHPDSWPDETVMAGIENELAGAIARGEYQTEVVKEKSRLLNYIRHWVWEMPLPSNEILSVMSRVLKVDPLDPWDLTRAEREGRAQAWEVADFYRRFVPGCEKSFLRETSNHIGVRSSRRICGEAVVTTDDAMELRSYPDEVARSSWDIDIWPSDSYSAPAVDRESAAWKERHERIKAGGYFGIRYGCLLAKGVENLMMAGRCISAEHVAESSLRIQQTCQATGQAAGTAAALSIQAGVSTHRLDPQAVVAQLEKDRAAIEPVAVPVQGSPHVFHANHKK
jgi:hypothetical protein